MGTNFKPKIVEIWDVKFQMSRWFDIVDMTLIKEFKSEFRRKKLFTL